MSHRVTWGAPAHLRPLQGLETVPAHSDIVPSGTCRSRSCPRGLGDESVEARKIWTGASTAYPFIHSFICAVHFQLCQVSLQLSTTETK